MKATQRHLQTLHEEPDEHVEFDDDHDDDHDRLHEQDQPRDHDPDPEPKPPAETPPSGSETLSPVHPIASADSSSSSEKCSISHPSSPARSPPHADSNAHNPIPPPTAAVVSVKRSVRDATGPITVFDPVAEDGGVSGTGGSGDEGRGNMADGGGRRRLRPDLSILRRARRERMMKRGLFALRVSGCVLCLISFSVLAATRARDGPWILSTATRNSGTALPWMWWDFCTQDFRPSISPCYRLGEKDGVELSPAIRIIIGSNEGGRLGIKLGSGQVPSDGERIHGSLDRGFHGVCSQLHHLRLHTLYPQALLTLFLAILRSLCCIPKDV